MCLTMHEYDVNTKLCSFVSLCSSVVAIAYLIVVGHGVDSQIACAVMRMLVRMTVFGYLFLFRELEEVEGSEQEQGPHQKNKQNFINLLHKAPYHKTPEKYLLSPVQAQGTITESAGCTFYTIPES